MGILVPFLLGALYAAVSLYRKKKQKDNERVLSDQIDSEYGQKIKNINKFQEIIISNKTIFEESYKPVAQIKIIPDSFPGLKESKFGGQPYWPANKTFPVDDNGDELCMIVQINCNDIPKPLGWPQEGLLQFFIARDDLYGLDNEAGYQVVYHENMNLNHEHHEMTPDDSYLPLVITAPQKIGFTLNRALPNTDNEYIEPKLLEIIRANEKEYFEWWHAKKPDVSHQIGGYPYFAQHDPRTADEAQKSFSTLLLQLDSDNVFNWGDLGTAQFFISPNDLQNKNFTNVRYDWSCY